MFKLKPVTVKSKNLTYQEALEFLKKNYDPTTQVPEDFLTKQQIMLGRLLFSQENKQIFKFFEEHLRNTKIISYYEALKEILSRLEDKDSSLMVTNSDSTLFYFKKFRYSFISFLSSRHIEKLYDSVVRLNNLQNETVNLNGDYEEVILRIIDINKKLTLNLI